MQIVVSGHSDDCIEVGEEEFYLREGRSFLRFSDGTVIECKFGIDGFGWQFDVVERGTSRCEESEIDGDLDMSVTLDGYFDWVYHDATAEGPDREQFEDAMEDVDTRDVNDDKLPALIAALRVAGVKV